MGHIDLDIVSSPIAVPMFFVRQQLCFHNKTDISKILSAIVICWCFHSTGCSAQGVIFSKIRSR